MRLIEIHGWHTDPAPGEVGQSAYRITVIASQAECESLLSACAAVQGDPPGGDFSKEAVSS